MDTYVAGALSLFLAACCNPTPPTTKPSEVVPAASVPTVAPTVSPLVAVLAKPRLIDAIAFAKPSMADTENDIDLGSVVLASWSADDLTWADLQLDIIPATTIGKMHKDSESERGHRLCFGGEIVEIAADKVREKRIFRGRIVNNALDVVSFIAVGSTGELVAKSNAKFCGITTGLDTYSNAAGGTSHAIRSVGMFDLPGNKKAKL